MDQRFTPMHEMKPEFAILAFPMQMILNQNINLRDSYVAWASLVMGITSLSAASNMSTVFIELVASNQVFIELAVETVDTVARVTLPTNPHDLDMWNERAQYAMSVLLHVSSLPNHSLGSHRLREVLNNWINRDDDQLMSEKSWNVLANMCKNGQGWFSSDDYVDLAVDKMRTGPVAIAIWGFLANVAAHRRLSNPRLFEITSQHIAKEPTNAGRYAWSFLYNLSCFDAVIISRDERIVRLVVATAVQENCMFQLAAMRILQIIQSLDRGKVGFGMRTLAERDVYSFGSPQRRCIVKTKLKRMRNFALGSGVALRIFAIWIFTPDLTNPFIEPTSLGPEFGGSNQIKWIPSGISSFFFR